MADVNDSRPEPREPAHLVSRRAIARWTVGALIGSLFLIVPQLIWWYFDNGEDRRWHWLVAGLTGLFIAVDVLVMPRWRYRVHRWEATPTAVYTQTGWFSRERRIAPLNRVQTVDHNRRPLDQLFGLSSVTVTTASAAGPVRIEGLDADVAERLVAQLTAAAEADKGDAT